MNWGRVWVACLIVVGDASQAQYGLFTRQLM